MGVNGEKLSNRADVLIELSSKMSKMVKNVYSLASWVFRISILAKLWPIWSQKVAKNAKKRVLSFLLYIFEQNKYKDQKVSFLELPWSNLAQNVAFSASLLMDLQAFLITFVS